MIKNINLKTEDSLFDPDKNYYLKSGKREAEFKRPITGNSPLYRVFLYLKGPDLPFVESVTYTLHPTFKERTLQIRRTFDNQFCKQTIWAWGIFEVPVVILFKGGHQIKIRHPLRYNHEFSKAEFLKKCNER